MNHLHHVAVFDGEGGSQGLVPFVKKTQGSLDRGNVESTLQPHRQRNMVNRIAGFEAIEKPQPGLRGGSGCDTRIRRERDNKIVHGWSDEAMVAADLRAARGMTVCSGVSWVSARYWSITAAKAATVGEVKTCLRGSSI